MGMSLVFEPVKKRYTVLSDELKRIFLAKHNGMEQLVILDYRDVDYIKGLMDAGVEDADRLISAIEKHGEIRVFLH